MIRWSYFPKNRPLDELSREIVRQFEGKAHEISSESSQSAELKSDEVLRLLRPSLENLGFLVELNKSNSGKIKVPVLFGENGKIEKSFDADCYNKEQNYVLEIEAGRAVSNYQFLKDLFQACVMVDVKFLGIAVKKRYRNQKDYETVCAFIDTLFVSNRLVLPINGILIIGY